MQQYIDRASDYVSGTGGSIWTWFSTLNREEWIIVLGACAAAGFICMLGHGSRSP